jgi:antitoxin HicB
MKPVYAIRIEPLSPDDGGGFIATVPELPGCMSDGETYEEALENVQDAIKGWLNAAAEWNVTMAAPRYAKPGTGRRIRSARYQKHVIEKSTKWQRARA